MKSKLLGKKCSLRQILLLVVVLLFLSALLLMAYTLTFGTTTLVKNLSDATQSENTMKEKYDNGIFSVEDIKYFERELAQAGISGQLNISNTNASLCKRDSEYLILELLFNEKDMPVKCDIMLDKVLVKNIKTDELFRLTESSINETLLPVNLGKTNPSKSHIVRVCCDSFCYEREIKPVCGQ
ncbi:MAG: hypothetical protein ACQESF_06210 [Nanobdellota archaeon]